MFSLSYKYKIKIMFLTRLQTSKAGFETCWLSRLTTLYLKQIILLLPLRRNTSKQKDKRKESFTLKNILEFFFSKVNSRTSPLLASLAIYPFWVLPILSLLLGKKEREKERKNGTLNSLQFVGTSTFSLIVYLTFDD